MIEPIAQLRGASKRYTSADQEIVALYPTDLDMFTGELTLIIGPSGSGKTTLLSLLGCVIYPSEGTVQLGKKITNTLNANQLAELRLHNIGFVFQSINLVAPLTALQNVLMPLKLQGVPTAEARERAVAALELVGLADRLKFKPRQLSGGQQQRVAIARALVGNAPMILADEPTASLDSKSMGTVMHELRALADQGRCVAVVTHDPRWKEFADKTVYVVNGIASFTEPEDAVLH
jgi:putative ABC transport system ATP-binding protein